MANKMAGHERIAAKNIRGAFNWEFGGIYNEYQDGYDITLTLNQMKDIVYGRTHRQDHNRKGSHVCIHRNVHR